MNSLNGNDFLYNATLRGTTKTDTISEDTAAAGVTIDGVKLKDGGALTITGGTNTFNITNGTASLDVAAGKTVNIDDDVTIAAELHVEAATHVNQDLTSDASPTFVTVKLSGLTDGYIPKHTADATGLENTNVYSDGNNVGLAQTSFGTSAAKVLAIGSGTAPTTSPADAAQVWVADEGGVAGAAALHMRNELGNTGAVGFKKNIVDTTAGALDLSSAPHKIADYIHEISAAGTVTLPAVSAALYGARMIVMVTAAVAVSIDPNASDRIVLAGTALTDGNKITNDSTAGSFVELYCDGANGWRTLNVGGVWIDGGA